MGRLALMDVRRDEDEHYGRKGCEVRPEHLRPPLWQVTGKYSIPLTQPKRSEAA